MNIEVRGQKTDQRTEGRNQRTEGEKVRNQRIEGV
jgi:hypothetical protein